MRTEWTVTLLTQYKLNLEYVRSTFFIKSRVLD